MNIDPNTSDSQAIATFLEQNPEVGLIGHKGRIAFFFYVREDHTPGGMSIHYRADECEIALAHYKRTLMEAPVTFSMLPQVTN